MKILAILYPGGEIAKNNPGLLGCAENALGLRDFLEKQGHEFVVLTDKEHKLDEHLSTTKILITTPFWPAYITKERISKAPMLRLILTAGVGSDHVDLQAAAKRGITVAEITGSGSGRCRRADSNAYFGTCAKLYARIQTGSRW